MNTVERTFEQQNIHQMFSVCISLIVKSIYNADNDQTPISGLNCVFKCVMNRVVHVKVFGNYSIW